jgi:hypothetical protein
MLCAWQSKAASDDRRFRVVCLTGAAAMRSSVRARDPGALFRSINSYPRSASAIKLLANRREECQNQITVRTGGTP